MGMWGSVVTVNTAAMHLFGGTKDPLIEALIGAILGNKSIPGEIMETMLGGLGVKMRPAFNYARDHYPLGIPTGKASTFPNVSDTELGAIIKEDLGDLTDDDEVVVESGIFTTISPVLLLYPDLLTLRGLDTKNGNITIHPDGVDYTPKCTSYTDPEHGDPECDHLETQEEVNALQHRMNIKKITTNTAMTVATVTYNLYTERITTYQVLEGGEVGEYVTYSIATWHRDPNTFSENFPIPNPDNVPMGSRCIYAVYRILRNGIPDPYDRFWLYVISDGTYPELDPILNGPEAMHYLPVIPLRRNNVNLTAEELNETELWITSRRLCRKLALDFEYLGEEVHKSPDIDDLDDIYIMNGADAQTESPYTLFYMGEYFNHLYSLQESDRLTYLESLRDYGQIPPPNIYETNVEAGIDEPDRFMTNGLNLVVSYSYITSELIVGRIGEKRLGRKGMAKKSHVLYTYYVMNNSRFGPGCGGSGDSAAENDCDPYRVETGAKLIIDMQISKRIIRRVTVSGLTIINWIHRKHSVVTNFIDVVQQSDNHNCIIPLQYELAQSTRLINRNMLYMDCALIIVNAYEKRDLEFYETMIFKIIIIIIAVIIAFYTGQYWLVQLAAAAAIGTMAVIYLLLQTIVFALILSYAMKWAVEAMGPELAMYFAIVVAIVSLVIAPGAAFEAFQMVFSTAQLMMQIAGALISAVNEFLIEEGQKLVDDFIDFKNAASEAWDELETAQELLPHNKVDIDPLLFARPTRYKIAPSESPRAFFRRCLELPSNSLYTIHGQIPDMHTQALTLKRTVSPALYNKHVYLV